MTKFKIIFFVILIILLILFVVASNTFANMILHPSWHHPGLDHNCSPSQKEYAGIVCIDNPESAIKEKFETVKIKYNPTDEVEGWYFPALKKKSSKLVIFVHGGGADRRNGYKLVPFLIQSGFSVLLYDSPNHGRSSNNGRGVTYGVLESQAFPSVVDWAHTKASKVYVIATSVGASTVALSQEKWRGKIEAIIFENPLLSLKELVKVNKIAKALPESFLNFVFKVVSWKGNFNPDDAAPVKYLSHFPDIPVIVMHGTKDETIPFAHGKIFYEKLNVHKKAFFQAEGTDHCRVWDKYPKKFEKMTISLFTGKQN